jgi:hypothetical protein
MEQKLTAFEILQSKLTIADSSEFRLTHIPEILEAMEEYANQKLTDYANQSHELMIELMAKGREDIYELMTKHTNLYKNIHRNSQTT